VRVLVEGGDGCCDRAGWGRRANTHGQSGRVVNPRHYACPSRVSIGYELAID
jgi:hypothetical protein